MNTTENLNCNDEIKQIGFIERSVIWLILHIRSDYFTYLLGVVSAFLTEEILNILQVKVSAESLISFVFMIIVLVVCIIITVYMLKFTIKFTDVQNSVSKGKTEKIQQGMLKEYTNKNQLNFKDIKKSFLCCVIFIVVLLCVMITQFVLLNLGVYSV